MISDFNYIIAGKLIIYYFVVEMCWSIITAGDVVAPVNIKRKGEGLDVIECYCQDF